MGRASAVGGLGGGRGVVGRVRGFVAALGGVEGGCRMGRGRGRGNDGGLVSDVISNRNKEILFYVIPI
jgi:hypothetical protein